MTTPTHILQENGSSRFPLIDAVRSFEDQIRFTLTQMDGTSFWALSLWRAPNGANLRASLPHSEGYIQCAGDAAGVTVEVRAVDEAGTVHQYTVGKPTGGDESEPTETIRWDEGRHSRKVHPHPRRGRRPLRRLLSRQPRARRPHPARDLTVAEPTPPASIPTR